jgi:hypothetical protein
MLIRHMFFSHGNETWQLSIFENVMKRFLILYFFVFGLTESAFCQNCNFSSTGTTCEDSVRQPDSYHFVSCDYSPVCGCDDKTYRNSGAAYWWGGINQWSDGPCGNFDTDLNPTLVTNGTSNITHIRIYMRQPGTATLLIYNVFGRLMLQRLFSTSLSNAIIPETESFNLNDAQSFPRGMYLAIVVVNGEQKVRKFLKVQE